MYLYRFVILCLGLLFSISSLAQSGSVVVLQYHNVSETTPRSTSISLDELKAHLQWLRDNHFTIKPLDIAVQEAQAGKYTSTDRIAAITFDDSHISVCETAWPYLQAEKVPFTIFINSDPIERRFKNQCNVQQLQTMAKSGLVIMGNHGKHHAHMVDKTGFASEQAWLASITEEIDAAHAFIEQHLGKQPLLFAYPYGEYNKTVQDLLKVRGYIAFGQQSGAIGQHSDPLGLPRFPLSGNYANLKTIPDKLNSLTFPARVEISSDNPISKDSKANPPRLVLHLDQPIAHAINCFLASGKPIAVQQEKLTVIVQHKEALGEGRQRYNCTAKSDQAGRYYWFSHQWLID